MSATFRYTGQNSVIYFNGVVISNDFTECVVEHKTRIEDRTAGNDLFQSFNSTIREIKVTFKKFDVGTSDTTAATLVPKSTGTFEVRPQGTGTGLPTQAFPAMVESFKQSTIFDKNEMIECSLVGNGTPTKDIGAVQ